MKRMSFKAFGRVVAEVMETLPARFQPYLDNLAVDVENEPDMKMLRDLGYTEDEIADGETLYGLFVPVHMADEPDLAGVDPDDEPLRRIIIYKRPLEDDFPDPKELRTEIRKTVIHELAHHFGFSDRDLERFDDHPDPFGDRS